MMKAIEQADGRLSQGLKERPQENLSEPLQALGNFDLLQRPLTAPF